VRVRSQIMVGSMQKRLRQMVKYQTRELKNVNNKLTCLVSGLVLTEERQRRELSAGLQDSTIQKLALARVQLDAIAGCVTEEPPRGLVDRTSDLVADAVTELRALVFDLSPPMLYEIGLNGALDWLAEQTQKRWGVAIECVNESDLSGLSEKAVVLIFRSTRELLMNLVQHANATQGRIHTQMADGNVSLVVEDNGIGFDPEQLDEPSVNGGFSLFSIRQRLQWLGGDLSVESGDSGSRVALVLPLSSDDQSDIG